MAPLKFHSVEWFAKGADVVPGDGVTLRGTITPMLPGAAFTQWGVQLERPHSCFMDAGDKAYVEEGGRALWNGRTFAVKAYNSFDGIGAADHTMVLMDEVLS